MQFSHLFWNALLIPSFLMILSYYHCVYLKCILKLKNTSEYIYKYFDVKI